MRGLDTRMKMNPPLRTEADRQALIEGLRSGVVDCIATDHAPHARDEKEVPFEQAPMGTTGLETAFAAVHTELVVPGVLDLALVVERMTAGGEPFGIPAPRVASGRARRTSCSSTSTRSGSVGEDGYESRSRATAASRAATLRGRVLLTVAAGGVAYRERAFAVVRHDWPAAYVLLEDGTRFDGDACGADADAAVTGEVVFTTGMAGYQESMTDPSFAAPAHHLHLPAHRQLRRLARRRWSPSGRGRARRSCARRSTARTRPAPSAAGWTGWPTAACPAITGVDTRALVRHIRDARARCAAASSPAR